MEGCGAGRHFFSHKSHVSHYVTTLTQMTLSLLRKRHQERLESHEKWITNLDKTKR